MKKNLIALLSILIMPVIATNVQSKTIYDENPPAQENKTVIDQIKEKVDSKKAMMTELEDLQKQTQLPENRNQQSIDRINSEIQELHRKLGDIFDEEKKIGMTYEELNDNYEEALSSLKGNSKLEKYQKLSEGPSYYQNNYQTELYKQKRELESLKEKLSEYLEERKSEGTTTAHEKWKKMTPEQKEIKREAMRILNENIIKTENKIRELEEQINLSSSSEPKYEEDEFENSNSDDNIINDYENEDDGRD